MSRLYIKTESDTRKNKQTSCAHQSLTTTVFYGSREESRMLVDVEVKWPKDKGVPTVTVHKAANVDVVVQG